MAGRPCYRRHEAGSDSGMRQEVILAVVRASSGGPLACYLRTLSGVEETAEVWSHDPETVGLVRQVNENLCPRAILADWVEDHPDRFTPGLVGRRLCDMLALVARRLREADAEPARLAGRLATVSEAYLAAARAALKETLS